MLGPAEKIRVRFITGERFKHLLFDAHARKQLVLFGWQSFVSRTQSAGYVPNWHASRIDAEND
jgi:hypothetical protein